MAKYRMGVQRYGYTLLPVGWRGDRLDTGKFTITKRTQRFGDADTGFTGDQGSKTN